MLIAILQEFNMSQRMAFCVFSGNGVAKLRSFLTDMFSNMTEDINADDEETEYDDDFDEGFNEVPQDVEMKTGPVCLQWVSLVHSASSRSRASCFQTPRRGCCESMSV